MNSLPLSTSRPRRAPRRAPRRGFTLAESLIASAVLAAAVIGIVAPLSAASRQADTASQSCAAAALARQLMEEIAAEPFAEPDGSTHLGPSAGKTARSQYDCLGDYHGYADSTAGLTSIDGSAVNFGLGGETFARSVTVAYMTGRAGPTAGTGDYALLTVTVAPPAGAAVTLSRVLCRGKVTW